MFEGHIDKMQATVFDEVVDKPRRREDADKMFQALTATGGSKRQDLETESLRPTGKSIDGENRNEIAKREDDI
jgi:hypothetical protein